MLQLPQDMFPGVDRGEVISFLEKETTGCFLLPDRLPKLLVREADAYKHRFGHVLVIAGSRGKGGAAILCSRATLRTGCGLVTVLSTPEVRQALLVALPEAMTMERDDGSVLIPDYTLFQSIAFGPGVGMDAGYLLFSLLHTCTIPLVIDADGISLLSRQKEWYKRLSGRVVLTPHAGEFDRLTKPHADQWARVQTQVRFSRQYQTYVLLKGKYTSVTTPEGHIYFNTSGNNGMATAGSGDVLTGMIASLIAQGYMVGDAACLGAYAHGCAGDSAAVKHSRHGMIASDIVEAIRL